MNKMLQIWQREGINLPEAYQTHKQSIHQKAMEHLSYKPGKRVMAVYDTADCPFSMDITTFLLNADNLRRQEHIDKMDVVILCQAEDPSPQRESNRITQDNYKHLLYNFFIESTRLYKNIGSVLVFDNRQQFRSYFLANQEKYTLYPEAYSLELPLEHQAGKPTSYYAINLLNYENVALSLEPPDEYVKLVRQYLTNKVSPSIPITITLREWKDVANGKNSNIAEWQKLINYYATRRPEIKFIVLRDYYELYSPAVLHGPNVIECNEAVIQLSFRAALYQECLLNLLINNGSASVALFNKNVNYIAFKFITRHTTNATEKLLAFSVGLEEQEQFHDSSMYQQLIYEPDDFEVMKLHVDRMLDLFEFDGKLQAYND
jgi:hypothetical protein